MSTIRKEVDNKNTSTIKKEVCQHAKDIPVMNEHRENMYTVVTDLKKNREMRTLNLKKYSSYTVQGYNIIKRHH